MAESCVSRLLCCHSDDDRVPDIIELRNESPLLAESRSSSGCVDVAQVISVVNMTFSVKAEMRRLAASSAEEGNPAKRSVLVSCDAGSSMDAIVRH